MTQKACNRVTWTRVLQMQMCIDGCLVCYSDYVYFLNVTVAGVYNQNYPGTGQAFKVRSLHCEGCWVPVAKLILHYIRDLPLLASA